LDTQIGYAYYGIIGCQNFENIKKVFVEDAMDISELFARINIELPHNLTESILYHSSYPQQDPQLRKRNREYVVWGHSIIEVSFAIYLYKDNPSISPADLSKKISTFSHYAVEVVYNKFLLEDFVIKSKSEAASKHPDIAAKLVAAIYTEIGFKKVYEFLYPFFEDAKQRDIIDYKTLVQEFAQAQKLRPQYSVLDTRGPAHELFFTCEIRIGKQAATAEGLGKKGAEREAAKRFAEKYHVPVFPINRSRNIENKQPCTISEYRRKQLDNAIRILDLDTAYIKYSQVDEILTHISYIKQHPNLSSRSNDCLSIVGASILYMLCADYILENYNLDNIALVTERGVLLNEQNLAKTIPTKVTEYLYAANEFISSSSSMAIDRIKIDILKSVIATYWLNYTRSGDVEIEQCCRKFAYKILRDASVDKILDYRSYIQIIAQKYGFKLSDEYSILESSKENDPVYRAQFRVEGPNWFVEGYGSGGEKKIARNNAAKDLLPLLLPYCSEDPEVSIIISRMLDPESQFLYEAKKKEQSTGKNTLPSNLTQTPDLPTASTKAIEHSINNRVAQKETPVPKEVSFDNDTNVLYICKGTISCRKNNHIIASVSGLLASLDGRAVRLNVNYCAACKLFFISYSEYKYYRDVYGALLGNFYIREAFGYSGTGYDNLAEESILKICGYTVNQNDNLSASHRQLILSNLMDRNVLSKYRVIEYLQFFINSSRYRNNMYLANMKWEADLQWVRSYNINRQRHFIIEGIQKYK
jgi:dsRNA-specific ribonuclease